MEKVQAPLYNGSSKKRALARAATTKGQPSDDAGGVQSHVDSSMSTILCTARLAAPFKRGLQEYAQASEAQGGPSIC